MIVLDSSAWIEIFVQGGNSLAFAKALEHPERLLVPSICLHEVYKYAERKNGPEFAEDQVAPLTRLKVVVLDSDLALASARLGRKHKLASADSIVYATALDHAAELWTQDADFEGLPGVRYLKKAKHH